MPTGTYGEQLRATRLAAGLYQTDVAAELGCSRAEVKRIEEAATRPTRSRFVERFERLVGFVWEEDPRLSQASEMQLVDALRRMIAARQPYDDTAGQGKRFVVERDTPGLGLVGTQLEQDPDDQGGEDDDQIGDGGPSSGVIQA